MTVPLTAPLPVRPSKRDSLLRKLVRNPMGVLSASIILVVFFLAIFGPMLAPYDPNFANIGDILAGPSPEHLLGTDSAGRDVLSRLLYGTQITVASAILCALVAIAIGLPAGLIAGYYGGPFDAVSGWSTNLIMALPGIIVLLAVRAAFGPSVWLSMVVFGVLISPSFYRLTRTAVQSVRGELYVDAARVSGLGDLRIIGRHIISVVRAPLIIQAAMVFGVAVSVQSGLEFLGLGDPRVPTWGVMLSEGFRNVYVAPLLILWPALAIGVTVGAFVLFANALRDGLEDRPTVPPRKRAKRESPKKLPASDGADQPKNRHLLDVEGVSIGFRTPTGTTPVVHAVSFHLDRGEVLGIVGESGSGKSQTVFSILGLLPEGGEVTGGRIWFDGVETVDASGTRQDRLSKLRGRRIAYIPQEPMSNLAPSFTIGRQLVRPMMKNLKFSRAEATRRAIDLLSQVGIADPERTMAAYPHEISGGMAQRVLIAGAVSSEPDLLMADEPTTALDVTVQAEVLDLLRDMRSTLGVGIVVVTHNFGVVSDLADRVLVMQEGAVVEEGAVRRVLRDPHAPYTRRLLGSMLQDKKPLTPLAGGIR